MIDKLTDRLQIDHASLSRMVRLVMLLEAAEKAGLVPIPLRRLHGLAYFSNVLAPVWDLTALDGKILKTKYGPFYPPLQRDVDRLVGCGVVLATGIGYELGNEGHWRLKASYRLHRPFAVGIIDEICLFADERLLFEFIIELAYALSSLSDEDLDRATVEDATYGDPSISSGNVVDFAEWRKLNFTENAARAFARFLPGANHTGPGELLHLYVRHLQVRLHGGR